MSLRASRFVYLSNDLTVMAKLTFLEMIHERVFYGLLVGFMIVFFVANIASSLSLAEAGRVFIDISFTGIHLFTLLIVGFYGCFALFKEKERRTLPLMLSKPVSRMNFILGKYLGIIGLIILILLLAYFMLGSLVWLFVGTETLSATHVLYMTNLLCLELTLLTAIAFLFSVITTSPLICFCFTVALYIIGLYHDLMQSIPLIQLTANLKSNYLASLLYYLSFLLPNFDRFNTSLVLDGSINASYVIYTNLYGLSYTAIVLALAVWIFSSKKLLV